MTAAPIPFGSRVVLVEDNKFGGTVFGEKGERGVVTLIDDEGDYEVRFDGEIDDWAVNASAVALESQGHDAALTAWERDTALGMAWSISRMGSFPASSFAPGWCWSSPFGSLCMFPRTSSNNSFKPSPLRGLGRDRAASGGPA